MPMERDSVYTFAVAFAVLLVWLILGVVVVAKHNEVQSWARGSAHVFNGSVVETTFGSTSSSATVSARAEIPSDADEVVRTVDVVLVYPPPPGALNLKGKSEVKEWLVFVQTADAVPVFVDADAGVPEPYTALTENIGVAWAIIGIVVLPVALVAFATWPFWGRYFDC